MFYHNVASDNSEGGLLCLSWVFKHLLKQMACLSVAIPSGSSSMLLGSWRRLTVCLLGLSLSEMLKSKGIHLRQCVKWCLTRMSHSVLAHYIFNILLLSLLLIGFLYPMPFIYKDTKKNHVCNFNNISPSFNIQSYFINSLNQKYFPRSLLSPPVPIGKITQHSSGYSKGQPHNSVLQFEKVKRMLECVWSFIKSRPSRC